MIAPLKRQETLTTPFSTSEKYSNMTEQGRIYNNPNFMITDIVDSDSYDYNSFINFLDQILKKLILLNEKLHKQKLPLQSHHPLLVNACE